MTEDANRQLDEDEIHSQMASVISMLYAYLICAEIFLEL